MRKEEKTNPNSQDWIALIFRAAASKGSMSCGTQEDVRLFVYPFIPPSFSRVKSQPQCSNLSLEAQIPALRLKSRPWDSNPSLKAQIPALRLKSQLQGWFPSLEAQIQAWRLKFQPQRQIPASKPNSSLKVKSQPQGLDLSFEAQILALQSLLSRSPLVFYRTLSPFGPLPC